jgi:hypothetical protein
MRFRRRSERVRPLARRGEFYRVKPFSGEVTHEAMIGKVVL